MVSTSHRKTMDSAASTPDLQDTLAVAVRTEIDRRSKAQVARVRKDGMLEVRAMTPAAIVSGTIQFDVEQFTDDRLLLKVSESGRMYVRSFPLWRATPSNETRANLAGIEITTPGVELTSRGVSSRGDRAVATVGAGRRSRQETEIWMTLAEYYAESVAARSAYAAC